MRARAAATKAAFNGGGEEAEDGPRSGGVGSGVGAKKKGVGVRAWLLLDSSGQAQVVEAGKHAIMRRTGLPARDLRILDPLLSYPSTILGRERAIVINLEHIKAIITAQEVLLLNSRDPAVAPFVADLQRRLSDASNTPVQPEGGNSDMDVDLSKSDMTTLLSRAANNGELRQPMDENSFPERLDTKNNYLKVEMNAFENGPKVLPFEFRALEACLEAACSCLESETGVLEEEAYPALDELTSKISTLNLERVRQIKSRLVAISGRVQKVRDELEHLLDDDEDMAEMYLTDKLMQQLEGSSSPSSFHGARGGIEHELTHFDPEDERGVEALSGTFNSLGRDEDSSTSSRTHSGTKGLDVEELEMLLEAYFVQIDGTLNKLSTLREYVDDTEDYINIMLDDKQNHLLQMGVMLTTATLVISAAVVVAGLFGMNITIDLFEADVAGLPQFLWVVGGCITDFVSQAVELATGELLAIAVPGQVTDVELNRAKNSTKSAVLMNLESRMVVMEDIGRQILTYGQRKPVEHFLNVLSEITLDDITSIAQKIISTPLTMAAWGDVVNVPSYDRVSSLFHAK